MTLVRPSLARLALLAAALLTALALVAPDADAAKKKTKKKKAKTVTSYVVKGGTATLTLDPTLVPVLTASGIAVSPIAPATLEGTENVTLPVSGGKLDIKKGTLNVTHKGGLMLGGAGLPIQINVTKAIIDATKTTAGLKADTLLGAATPLLDIKGFKLPKKVTGKSVDLVGTAGFVEGIGTTLKGFVPTLPGPPVPFGTITLSLELK
jgi:hypothetical protein